MNYSQKFKKTVKDIKELKIQGAQNVAREGVNALKFVLKSAEGKNRKELLKFLEESKKELFASRPTEPALRNAVSFALAEISKIKDRDEIEKKILNRIALAIEYFHRAQEKIIDIGSKKIKNNSIVFTHCHSSTVTGILIKAKKDGKKFVVHNTETRPLYQGRITAKELAKNGIPVIHFVDSAARLALKKADLFLMGADAVTSEGNVINKIGSELFSETAKKFGVPIYSCTHAWKFDSKTVFGYEEKIEMRYSKEVWSRPPKGVQINNFAFESVDASLLNGIISELGIYKPQIFIEETLRKYPWMLKI